MILAEIAVRLLGPVLRVGIGVGFWWYVGRWG
jgi:hypothetical protein